MSKINLNISERAVLLETDSIRVVGIGRAGYRLDVLVEKAHKDAMGEVSWQLLDKTEFRSDHTSVHNDLHADALLAALDRVQELGYDLGNAFKSQDPRR